MSEYRSECVIEGAARPTRGRLPVAAVVVVGFLLAAIVGMTSAASPWISDDGSRPSAPAVVGDVLAVAIAAGLCILLGLIWINMPGQREVRKKRAVPAADTTEMGSSLRTGSLVLIGVTLAVLALILVFWFLLEQADVVQPPPLPNATTVGGAGALPPAEPPPSASSAFDWFLVGLIASMAVVLPLGLLARRRHRVADVELASVDVPESVVRAVGESIDQIERDPDARRAIIRAYAQMEHAFDDAGIPRRPYEAPFEYLGRALRGVRVSPPAAGRLAALFERARFSQHAVGTETKGEAIAALRDIEQQMQEPTT
jgi:hypothetical protein